MKTSSSTPPPAEVEAAPLSAELQEQVARSSAIGRQLYVLDKVSAIATDVVLAEIPDLGSRGIVGYLPLQRADDDGQPTRSFGVSFFTADVPPRLACEVVVAPDTKPKFEAFSPPKSMPEPMLSLVRARQAAIAALGRPAQPINPVLLSGEAIGEHGIVVYLLAGTNRANVAVLGKHSRALVSEDGMRVLELTALSNSVLELPTRDSAGARAEALTVTHVVSDFPLETYVFASLLAKLPIYVSTRRGVWRVDGDRIDFLGAHAPSEAGAKLGG